MNARGRNGLSSIVLASVVLCFLGCVSAAERLQRWEGHQVADLVADRGPADRIVQYPYGGRLYIWEQESAAPMSADATAKRASAGQRLDTRLYREMALVGDNGIIIRTHVGSATKGSTPSF